MTKWTEKNIEKGLFYACQEIRDAVVSLRHPEILEAFKKSLIKDHHTLGLMLSETRELTGILGQILIEVDAATVKIPQDKSIKH